MIYVVKINNKKYEVEVEKGQATILNTEEIAAPATAPSVPAAPAPVVPAVQAPAAPVPAAQVTGHPVKAPMPGTVLDIKVQVGSRVHRGDVLLVFEAMKMENEVAAHVDGVIAQILVNKGSSINTDDLLLTIQ